MRITDVEAFAIRIPRNGGSDEPGRPPVYSIPDGRHSIKSDMHETLVVRVTTDAGLAGYGEGQSPVSPETPMTIVDNLCRPLLVGADPFDVDYIWQRQFDGMRERGHLTGFYVDALAACDIALWDLMGKATGKPAHKLLGGRFRDRIELYTGCAGREPDSAADRAEALERRAFDVLMPDIGRTGLTEGKRIAVLADTYNIPVSPHVGGGGLLSIAATIQLSAAIPNFLVMEHGHGSYPTACRIALDAPQPVDGAFPVNDEPGLGVRIDDSALRRFSRPT